MYILSMSRSIVMNTENISFIEVQTMAGGDDWCSMSAGDKEHWACLGVFKDLASAQSVLLSIFDALGRGDAEFVIPESELE